METFKKMIISTVLALGMISCNAQKPAVQNQDEAFVVDKTKSVEIGGEEFHYIEKGSGDPIIFIHGTTGDYRTWLSHVDTYSKDFHAIAYSRRYAYPNSQKFDKSLDYSARIHADDLSSFIKKLGLNKVNIVGHSYGAFTALIVALENPEVVNSLVLGEPGLASLAKNTKEGRESLEEYMQKYLRPAKDDFTAGNNEAALEHFVQWIVGDDFQLSQMPSEAKQRAMDNLPELWGMAMNEDFSPILDEHAIQSLEVPILVVVGDISPIWLIEGSEQLHRLLPKSEIVRFENMNHGLYFEQPEAVNKVVMDFLVQN